MSADHERPPSAEEAPGQSPELFEPEADSSIDAHIAGQDLVDIDPSVSAPTPGSHSLTVPDSWEIADLDEAQLDIDIRASEGEIVSHRDSVRASDDSVAANRDISISAHEGGIAAGVIHGNVYNSAALSADMAEARDLFMGSLRHRDEFVGSSLKQALQQANTTFRLSVFFTTMGGLFVLCAAVLAITRFAGSPSHGIALVSGIAGVLIGTSGAAFSLRSDKARKHLATQASMMHSQLLDERKFTQVIDLLAGIHDPQLNDQARVSLAMRLMGEAVTSKEAVANKALAPSPSKPGRRNRWQREANN